MVQTAHRPLPPSIELTPILRGVFGALVDELQTLRRKEQQQRLMLERLQSQVAQVASLQRELLPTRLPKIDGLSVHTLYRPAETVSGDWYDIVRLDDRRTAFLLADATGHGLPAGMFSTLTRSCFQLDESLRDPAAMLDRANRDVLRYALSDCPFVGAIVGIHDESTGTFTLARAGLPYPVLVRGDGEFVEQPCGGPALGTVEDARFENITIQLQPGDRLILHSDGVDAIATDWKSAFAASNLEDALHHLDDELAQARARGGDIDDLTIIALEAT